MNNDQVLLDLSALEAILCGSDRYHAQAAATLAQLVDTERELWMTSYALAEATTLLHRRFGTEVALAFSKWRETNVKVLWIDNDIHSEAHSRFVAAEGNDLSFIDWTTAVASRELNAAVFAFTDGFADKAIPVVPYQGISLAGLGS